MVGQDFVPMSPVFSDIPGNKAQKIKTKPRVGNMKGQEDGERRKGVREREKDR